MRSRPKARSSEAAVPTQPAVGVRQYWLALSMAFAIVLVFCLAYWDERREALAAFEDFAQEQTTLAHAAGASLRSALDSSSPLAKAPAMPAASAIERPGELRLLVRAPGSEFLVAQDGARVWSDPIVRALDQGARWVRLTREEASALGLSERTAVSGLDNIDAGPHGTWGLAVVATASRQRDHESRARWRLILTVVVTSSLILAFGGLANRVQRKRLELSQELVIADLRRERDERLVRADKLATLGALSSGVAHEVSTPLAVILGRAEQLLPRVASDDRSRRAVEVILEQTDRINQVIRGFLNLARGNAPRFQHVAPASLARAAVDLVQHRFETASVSLLHDIPEHLPEVACEPRLFEQVLVNLLLNACDACEAGGAVRLQVIRREERIVFSVTDDGHGISREAAKRAVEPFFTTKPAGKGTGLGLAIANEIVHHHCGTLTIAPRAADPARDGTAAHGTVATVQIPMAQSATSPAEETNQEGKQHAEL